MKKLNNLNNWEMFLELNSSTYKNASDLAKKYGRKNLADDLENHAKNMKQVENEKKLLELHLIDDDEHKTCFIEDIDNLANINFWVDDNDYVSFQVIVSIDGNTNYCLDISLDTKNQYNSKNEYIELLDFNTDDDSNVRFTSRLYAKRFIKLLKDNKEDFLNEYKKSEYNGMIKDIEEKYQKFIDIPIHRLYN